MEPKIRQKIRATAGLSGTPYPIVVVEGDAPPVLKGETYHYTTPGGKPIRYPNAYRWPKVYHCSTLRIEVGSEFVVNISGVKS